MKIIDARSGTELRIGQTINYPDGESVTLLDADVGLFSGEATVRVVEQYNPLEPLKLRTRTFMCPLQVRWTHPSFFLQHVAFIPS